MRAPRQTLPAGLAALALLAAACGEPTGPSDDPGDTSVDVPADDPDHADGQDEGEDHDDGDSDGDGDDRPAEPGPDDDPDLTADGIAPACEDVAPDVTVDGDLSDDDEIAQVQQQRANAGLPSDENTTRNVIETTDPDQWSFPFPHTLEEQDELEGRGGVADDHVGGIREWVADDAADEFGGLWVDQAIGGALVVAFTDDVEAYTDELHDRFSPEIVVVEVEHSHRELEQVQDDISDQLPDQDTYDPNEPGTVVHYAVAEDLNRVEIALVGGDDDALRTFSDTHGAERICFLIHDDPHADREPDDRVTVLARADGWRADLQDDWDIYQLLEIADDERTAQRAWDDNVPSDLPDTDPDAPAEPGLYAGFDELDLDTHALVVWSAGESGSCPEWIHSIDTLDSEIEVTLDSTAGPGQACTDDFSAYRLVLAVDRDVLPAPDQLPLPLAGGDHIELSLQAVAYPQP